jgi:hypothetical protein
VRASSWNLQKYAVAALGAFALSATALSAPASAAGTSTVVPITTFTVKSLGVCAGGSQSQLVRDVDAQLGYLNDLLPPLPTVSLNPGCNAPAPSALSALINASSTESSSPSGSATLSSEALGNVLLTEQASAGVTFTASVPLSSPASSVDVTIPYTTTGVTMTPLSGGSSYASSLVLIDPNFAPNFSDGLACADGSVGTMAPYNKSGSLVVFPIGQDVPAGSGTINGIRFYCPDGSDLVSGVSFVVEVLTDVYAADGQTESASVNFDMNGASATIHS